MNAQNFLKRLHQLITGDGFWREVPVPLRNFHKDDTGATLTTTITANPGFDKDGTLTTLAWAATKVIKAGVDFQVPGDFDETRDKVSVWVLAKSAGAVDTPTFTIEAFTHRASATDLAPAAVAALSAAYAWREVNLDGKGLLANDAVHLTFVPAGHATDIIHVAAVKVRYRGDLVIYDKDERSSGTPA